MNIVAVEAGDWEYSKGKQAAATILVRKPEIRALLYGNDNMAIVAVDAVREARRSGTVFVTGYNNSNAIKPLLKDGTILATVDQFAAKQAVYRVDVALQALLQQRKQDELSVSIETPVMLSDVRSVAEKLSFSADHENDHRGNHSIRAKFDGQCSLWLTLPVGTIPTTCGFACRPQTNSDV